MAASGSRYGEVAPYVVFASLVAAAVFLNSWGRFTPDTLPELYQAPGRTLTAALFAWQPNPYLGIPNYNTGVIPAAAVVFLIRSLGASAWVAVRIWRLLLLLVASFGAASLFDHLVERPSSSLGRITVATLYVANPFVIASGSTPYLLPYAVFPWLMLALARSVEQSRSWKWPAWFALAFFLMGGIDAGIVPAYTMLGVPCYLLYSRLALRIPYRTLARAAAKCLGFAALVSLYWVVPTFLQRGTGAVVGFATESPQAVASTSSYSETLRLLGLWSLYGRQASDPWTPNLISYLTNPLVVLATFMLPIAAAVSAFLSRSRTRAFAAILLAVGAPVMVGMFPPLSPTPFGQTLKVFFLDVTGAVGFRNTHKVGALLALSFTLLLGLGAVSVGRLLARARLLWRIGAAIAAALVVGLTVYPAWTGNLYSFRWEIPGYWRRAAAVLNTGPRTTRVLFLPGQVASAYRWGERNPNDLNPSLLSRPSVRRSTLPSGSLYAANFLAALDVPMNAGFYRPGTLRTMARYLGVDELLARNDIAWEQLGSIRPSALAELLAREPGIRLVGSFGKPGQNTTAPGSPGPTDVKSIEAGLPPLQRYQFLAAPRTTVRAENARGVVLIDGDSFAIPTMASLGLLRGEPAFRFLGSMTAQELSEAIRSGARIVLTDTNRRRQWDFSRTGQDYGATLGADETYGPTGHMPTLTLFPSQPRTQTVAVLDGAESISATSYGFGFGQIPYGEPYFAFDGDPSTAWITGSFRAPVRQAITIRFTDRRTLSELTLRPLLGRPVQIDTVRITMKGRSLQVHVSQDPETHVTFPPTSTTFVTVQITSVRGGSGLNPVGFYEIAIPGVSVSKAARLPITFDELAGRLDAATLSHLAELPIDIVLVRQKGDPGNVRDDEETTLDREVELPQARSFAFSGTVGPSQAVREGVVDGLIGLPSDIQAVSSSRADALFERAAAALDGDTGTAWVPASSRPGEYIDVTFPSRKLDHIDVSQGPQRGQRQLAVITGAELSIDGGPPLAVKFTSNPMTITFPRQRVHELRLTITGVSGLGGPVGIRELAIAGISLAPSRLGTPLTGCIDAFQVDGLPVPVRVPGTLGGLSRPFAMIPCSDKPLTMEAGPHRIEAVPGWQIDQLVLSSPGLAGSVSISTNGPRLTVPQSSPTAMTIVAARAVEPYYLVAGQAFDQRWKATMDGRDLGRPILVDGYSVGWLIRDTRPHRFLVSYGPQRAVTGSLVISVAGLGLALALIFARRREP